MTPEERKRVLEGLAHWIRHGEGFPPSGGRMVWAEAIEDSVDADARADRAEDAMVEIQRLIPAGGMIRVSDLTKIMEIIKAYKEAKNE